MSASSTGIPPVIEQQLLSLDKQIRDATFIRGAGRFVLGACVLLASSLLLDSWLDLSGSIRFSLLGIWVAFAGVLLWRGVIRPAFQPISFSALAALVEKQFPELSERLTSLVELRGADGDEIAPGASTLMQDLLARQTVKALDSVSVEHAASHRDTFRAVIAAAVAALVLLAPFGWNSDGYGLLWARFFVPLGNYGWGSSVDLKVVEGDQVIARGADVNVHVTLTNRRNRQELGKELTTPIWLNWHDENGSSDSRRLDWDDQSQQFLATLPHVRQTLTYDVTTSGAKSGTFRVDVSDPPSVTQWKMDIEPAAYTGLAARTLTGIPGEIRVPEFSRIGLSVEFNVPVAIAELKWPAVSEDAPKSVLRPEQMTGIELSIPLELSADRRSGTASVSASLTGSYAIVAKNNFGLQNNEPSRLLTVIPDQPPQIQLDGDDQPILARPDDVVELGVEVKDDYGLTAVELHTETSAGNKHVESLPANERFEGHVQHKFVLDLAQFDLNGGQTISYRVRAVDNRPHPNPQEVWTPSRTVVINTSSKQLPDRELAQSEQSLEDELSNLRTELNRNKADLAELHQETEQEALNKQAEADKSERLAQLQTAQDKLIEKMQQLADRLAARRMTQDLAAQAQQIAEGDLQKVQDRLDQSKNLPSRDQLEPLSQAIDNLGTADRQLRQLEQQLVDLNKLEQDLAELSRMAQHAERLADQLDKLDAEQKAAANADQQATQAQQSDGPAQANQSNDQPVSANEKNSQTAQSQSDAEQNPAKASAPDKQAATDKPQGDGADARDDTGIPKKLKDEASKLADQMQELLKKHPELLEAAKREQLDNLNDLAEQARKLAGPQQRLAEALKEAAANAPAMATRPDNANTHQSPAEAKKPGNDSQPASAEDPVAPGNPPKDTQPAQEKANPNQSDSPNPADKDAVLNGADKPKTPTDGTDQKPSPEKSDESISRNVKKDQPQKPTDATNPGDSDKPSDALNPSDPSKSGDAASKDSTSGEKAGADKSDSNTNPKPGTNQASDESMKNGQANPSTPKQGNPNSDAPNLPDKAAVTPTDNQAASQPSTPSNQSDPVASKSGAENGKPSSDENKPGADAKKPGGDGISPSSGESEPATDRSKAARADEKNGQPPNTSDQQPASPLGNDANSASADKKSQAAANSPPKSAETNAQQMAQQAGSDAARQQEQIAREAAKQALEMARETGADSDATKAATDFARKADAAKQQAQAGQLSQAAKEAQQAAKAADQAAQQLNPDGQSNTPQSKQAQQLADKQNAAAKQLESLASSPAAVKGAQLQGQKQLADATSQLAEQMDSAAKSLNSTPLNSPKEAKSGEKASLATKQAEQAMNQAAKANQQNDPQQAAQAASDAAEKLKQAADSVPPSPPKKQNSLPVPKSVASQVAEVTKKIETAQKELSQCNCQNPSAGGGKSASSANPSSNPSQAQQPSTSQPKPSQNQQSSKPSTQTAQNGNQQSQNPQDPKQSQSQQASKAQGDKPGQGQQDSKPQGQSPANSNQQASNSQGNKPGQGQQDSKSQGQSPPNGNQQASNSQGGKPGQGQQDSKSQGQSPPNSNQQASNSQGDKPGQGQQDSKSQGQSPPNSNQQASKSQGDKSGQDSQAGDAHGQQRAGQADQSSKVGSGQQTASDPQPSQIAQVADHFREVAAMLRQARVDPKENLNPGQPMRTQRPGKPMSGQMTQQSEPGESGANASGTTETLDLSHLDAELQQLARHNWGRLPGQLRTEILQGAGKKSHPEYTQRIKSYFDEITKPAK